MTPDEIKLVRQGLGLTLEQFGTLLGYSGNQVRSMMHRLEIGERPLRPAQRRLIDAYLSGYRPDDWPIT